MRKRILSFALALALCLGLLPVTALAAEKNLPDWYFLFAIFKNADADGINAEGEKKHAKYTMPQEEIEIIRDNARDFEAYMNSLGIVRAHVEVAEIDTPITELDKSDYGAWVGTEQAVPLLKGKVDLDRYDHVFCVISLDDLHTSYLGLTGVPFANGTGHSCFNLKSLKYCLDVLRFTESEFPPSMYVHEFLHFMNQLNNKWGEEFDLHLIGDRVYSSTNTDAWKTCYTDIILNRVNGDSETGTGVHPAAWQYPPRVLRTMTELSVPSGVTGIKDWTFANNTALKKVTIPGSVAEIGKDAFVNCTGLTELTIRPGVTGIGNWAFGCQETRGALTTVTIPASVTHIDYAAFYNTSLKNVYYGGTEEQWKAIKIGDYNGDLTKATIHYNSSTTQPQQPAKPATADPTNDKLTVNGSAADPTVYKIDGNNYFKIRDVAALLNGTEKQFTVGYDNTTKSATATTGQPYTKQGGDLSGAATGGNQSATPSNDAIYVDGQKIDAQVYKIGGSNYFKLRDLGKALNFCVGWSREQGMFIDTTKPYTE